MRVIEPNKQLRRPTTKRKTRRKPVRTFFFLALFVAGSFAFLLIAENYHQTALKQQAPSSVSSASSVQDLEKVAGAQDVKFRYFSGDQFQRLYEKIHYPNTVSLESPPLITGDEVADKRIRTIAESRGYVLRDVPVRPIIKTGLKSDKTLLQPKSYQAWQVLKDLAKKDGVPLELSSAYRSVDVQREMFLDRLSAAGASISDIAAGTADEIVVNVLHSTAPPGYSRHHTGYTVDLVCGNAGLSFKYTTSYSWLKANNYDKAKRAGWIPSYPEGADEQGPEPEPWEYVWVGLPQLVE
jgi:LAS superfamily LD-carboxypeptidase LdcB